MELTRRNVRTLEAAARVLVPAGGAIPWGADDVDLARRTADEVASWPPRVRRQIRAFLTAIEYAPIATHRRPFTKLDPDEQRRVLLANYHHRSAPRRLVVALLKQLCYTTYLQTPEVEDAIGYRYECAKPRGGVRAEPREQIHH